MSVFILLLPIILECQAEGNLQQCLRIYPLIFQKGTKLEEEYQFNIRLRKHHVSFCYKNGNICITWSYVF